MVGIFSKRGSVGRRWSPECSRVRARTPRAYKYVTGFSRLVGRQFLFFNKELAKQKEAELQPILMELESKPKAVGGWDRRERVRREKTDCKGNK